MLKALRHKYEELDLYRQQRRVSQDLQDIIINLRKALDEKEQYLLRHWQRLAVKELDHTIASRSISRQASW